MESIIVTVTNMTKSFFYDLEVPVNVEIESLKYDIVATLNGMDAQLRLDPTVTYLYFNRMGRRLKSNETMERAGVWNGDYITMIEV